MSRIDTKLGGNATLLLAHQPLRIRDIFYSNVLQKNKPQGLRRCQYGLLVSKHRKSEGRACRVSLQQKNSQNKRAPKQKKSPF